MANRYQASFDFPEEASRLPRDNVLDRRLGKGVTVVSRVTVPNAVAVFDKSP